MAENTWEGDRDCFCVWGSLDHSQDVHARTICKKRSRKPKFLPSTVFSTPNVASACHLPANAIFCLQCTPNLRVKSDMAYIWLYSRAKRRALGPVRRKRTDYAWVLSQDVVDDQCQSKRPWFKVFCVSPRLKWRPIEKVSKGAMQATTPAVGESRTWSKDQE